MSLPSAFQERLRCMDETRSQRLAQLQAEKEIQLQKFHLLSLKIANQRVMEQRCLMLEKRNAELGFSILANKSEIDGLGYHYERLGDHIRVLKNEIQELEEREKEKDDYYAAKIAEIEEFNERKRIFVSETREQVQNLRDLVWQLKSDLKEYHSNDKHLNNAEIAAAEARHMELLHEKEKLEKQIASSCQLRTLLQKQLQKMLMTKERKNISSSVKNIDEEQQRMHDPK